MKKLLLVLFVNSFCFASTLDRFECDMVKVESKNGQINRSLKVPKIVSVPDDVDKIIQPQNHKECYPYVFYAAYVAQLSSASKDSCFYQFRHEDGLQVSFYTLICPN